MGRPGNPAFAYMWTNNYFGGCRSAVSNVVPLPPRRADPPPLQHCPVTPQSQCQLRAGRPNAVLPNASKVPNLVRMQPDQHDEQETQPGQCVDCKPDCAAVRARIERQLNSIDSTCGTPGKICGAYTWLKTAGPGGVLDTLGEFINACFAEPLRTPALESSADRSTDISLEMETSDSSILEIVDEPDRINLLRKARGAVTLGVTASQDGQHWLHYPTIFPIRTLCLGTYLPNQSERWDH